MDLHLKDGRVWKFQWREGSTFEPDTWYKGLAFRKGWYYETKQNLYRINFSTDGYPMVTIGRLFVEDRCWTRADGWLVRAERLEMVSNTVLFK